MKKHHPFDDLTIIANLFKVSYGVSLETKTNVLSSRREISKISIIAPSDLYL